MGGEGGLEDCQVEIRVRAAKQQLLTRASNPENGNLKNPKNISLFPGNQILSLFFNDWFGSLTVKDNMVKPVHLINLTCLTSPGCKR